MTMALRGETLGGLAPLLPSVVGIRLGPVPQS